MKPYFDDGQVAIYVGDCLAILPELDIQGAACVVDPPYNAGKNYGKTTNDRQAWPVWASWLDERFDAWEPFAGETFMFLSQTAHRQYERHGRHSIDWDAIWHKPLSMAVCAAPFMPHWEYVSYFGKRKKGQERHANGHFVKGQKGAAGFGGDVFTHNVEYGKPKYGHPTPKPLPLLKDIISRLDHQVILDPFCGSGTALKAAQDAGLRAVGIEISEEFAAGAVRRLTAIAEPRNRAQQVLDLEVTA